MNSVPDKRDLLAVLKLIRKYNLKQTEELLREEANIKDEIDDTSDSDFNNLVSTINSHVDNVDNYENSYIELIKFIDNSLDIYKYELKKVLYPVLIHIYFKLMNNDDNIDKAKLLLKKFGPIQESYYENDIKQLLTISNHSQLLDNELVQALKQEKFTIRILRDSLSILKRIVQDKKLDIISEILNKYIYFDVYEGAARSKSECDTTSGAMLGESKRSENKTRVFYGLLKDNIDLQSFMANNVQIPEFEDDEEDNTDNQDDFDKPKKKKVKKDVLFSKKFKPDPNAPPYDRIPLPELKYSEKFEKIKALKESSKRVVLNKDSLPSVCFYTVLNSKNNVLCAEISEDCSLLALGFSDAYIKIWSLTQSKLRETKPADKLKELDINSDDILIRMMDDHTAAPSKNLYGHCGPIYRCSFSLDRTLLVSCSEDTTIRLWSLQLWTCVVVYKGHEFPVWDVRFSPYGYYFASCSYDRTARLWSTDSYKPHRIFFGHFSDVDCVQFHPNSNYIATGSFDRTVRLWDCLNGNQIRLMTGHKDAIYSLAFSICGRYLASGSADCNIIIWDLQNGQLISILSNHTGTVNCLCFSRDGNILGSGGMDCALKIWDFTKLCNDYVEKENKNSSIVHNFEIKDDLSYLIRSFPTKSTPFLTMNFSRRNLLLAVGSFQ